jgi:hypothetical protein
MLMSAVILDSWYLRLMSDNSQESRSEGSEMRGGHHHQGLSMVVSFKREFLVADSRRLHLAGPRHLHC